jgi:hypothetical protein
MILKYDPQSKRQSLQRKQSTFPRPKKPRMPKSQMKTMFITFFDIKGFVHFKFIPKGRTVNKAYCMEILKRLSEPVLRKKREL